MRPALVALASAALLLGAQVAEAAQRYSAPAGSGTACTQAAPCPLAEAIGKATSGDEVIVGGGTYDVPTQIVPSSAEIDVHGDLSGPMPEIVGKVSNGAPPILVPASGGRLSYLAISNESASKTYAGFCNPGGVIERVRLAARGPEADALTLRQECTVRDSLILAEGTSSRAIHGYGFEPTPNKTVIRNVTAIATGPGSAGIDAEYTQSLNPDSYTVDVKNSILAGEAADVAALVGLGGPGNVQVSNSNFDVATAAAPATVTGGANQEAPPIFVDAANGDYREAAGSPTIDAGSSDQIGALDLGGNPRSVGAAPDIGAFEFVPAPPPPPPLASIESLALSPKVFRARRAGEAVTSRTRSPRAPAGSTVVYRLSSGGTVAFGVERALMGRRVGRKCVKPTRANRARKRCVRYRKLKNGFAHAGATGENKFKFSGRIGGKALKPGRYRLVGTTGDSKRRAGFKIVR